MNQIPAAIMCTLAAAGTAFAAAATATLQGSVTGDDGSPIPNAIVLFHRIPLRVVVGNQLVPAAGEAVVNSSVSADSTGAFNIANLPQGNYSVCARAVSGPYLDSCKWSSPAVLAVSSASTTRQNFTLKKGVYLKVRVNDTGGLLPAVSSSPFAEPDVIIGVIFGNGAYLSAVNTGVDQFGRDYQMPIPAGVPLKLWVFSRKLSLTDSSNAPLPPSGSGAAFSAAAGQDQAFALNVSGKIP